MAILVRSNPIPKVSASNEEATRLLLHSFSMCGSDTWIASRKSDFEATLKDLLRIKQRGIDVSISYRGERLNFDYEGPIKPSDSWGVTLLNYKPGVFYESNELYYPVHRQAMEAMRGVTHYVGIAGGLDAPVAQLGIVPISGATHQLVDRNPCQIWYDMLRLYEYDKKDVGDIMNEASWSALHRTGSFPTGMEFQLVNADLADTARNISQEGVYMIYTSNAYCLPLITKYEDMLSALGDGGHNYATPNQFTGHGTIRYTRAFLQGISDNENILEGSYVIFSEAYSPRIMIIKKELRTFKMEAFIGYGVDCVYSHEEKPELDSRPYLQARLEPDIQKAFFDEVVRQRRG